MIEDHTQNKRQFKEDCTISCATESTDGLDPNSPFPVKLYALLKQNHGEVVYWLDHGLAFRVGNPTKFAREILPKYFKRKGKSSNTLESLLNLKLIIIFYLLC